MTHLVPNPPPRNYQVPTLTEFTVAANGVGSNGVAQVLAWGIPPNATNGEYKIKLSATGPNGFDRIESDISNSDQIDLKLFTVCGLREGDSIAVFKEMNFSDTSDTHQVNWIRCTGAVKVHVAVDTSAAKLAAGQLTAYSENSNITFYSYGAMQHLPPVSETDWQKGVIDTLNQICAIPLGKQIVKLVPAGTVIYPWTPSFKNATSEVCFTPQDWTQGRAPGFGPDEILLHELVHVIEYNADNYSDASGFVFDAADFLTVNATNVYSCLLGRGLRKDHAGYRFLPQPYFDDPKKHYTELASNYAAARNNAPALCAALKTGSDRWNPFKF